MICYEESPHAKGLHAAGQGFEPRLPGPEPGVLPLDDPAITLKVKYSISENQRKTTIFSMTSICSSSFLMISL